jgi:hypothetical protein
MKMRLLVFLLIAVCVSAFFALALGQPKLGKTAKVDTIGKTVTIPQLQMVSMDSLKKLDTLQNASSGAKLDKSPYWHGSDANADTVRVTGVVIVKPSVLTYTLQRYNTYIQDTTTGQLWAGLNVLTDDSSANAQNTGIPALDTGMVVTITGRVTEFYTSNNNSLTEMYAYKSGFFGTVVTVDINGYYQNTGNRPAPVEVTCDSFAVGTTPMPSRAEKYEGMYVVVRNVTVSAVDQSYGSFTFQDAAGNMMKMYDGSGWFTKRGHAFKNSTYTPPPVGTVLKYIRGVVLPQSRTGTCGDYTIMPMYPGPKELAGSTYPGDIVIDKYGPAITTFKRTPTPPKSTDIVNVTYKSYNPVVPAQNADSSFFRYRVGRQTNRYGTGWQRTKINPPVAPDSLYRAQIPAQADSSLVSYFAESWLGGVYSAFPDSTVPYFYVVRDAGPSLYDVCFTPYANGQSGFAYDTVTVSGVIIADTSDIKDIYTRGGRANAPLLWLQAGTATSTNNWRGIQIWSPTGPIVDTLKRGDSVSVRGSVYGTTNRTQLAVTSMPYFRRGSVIPAPYIRSMSSSPYFDYALSNPAIIGNSGFQPWMSMLQELDNVYVIYRNADNTSDIPTSTATYGEFFISNAQAISMAAYGVRVNDNGVNHYYTDTNSIYISGGLYSYNSTHPFTAGIKGNKAYLIPLLAKLSYIRGMLDYTNSNYKLEPRQDDDFGIITVGVYQEKNILPAKFTLEQNYPNPFNPSTTIRYTVPAKSNVTLRIYNLLGQQVESLINMEQGVGSYVVQYNASRLATGVYFYELRAGDYRDIKKMLLLK